MRTERHKNHIFAALQDLYRLLEDHAPRWYTLDHHRRSELGLRQEGQEQAEAFMALYNLLEEYAPAWYSKEVHERAERAAQRLKNVQKPVAQRARARRAHA